MKKQHIKLKFVNLTVLVLALGMTACGSVPTKTFAKDKTFVKDFDANYVMKPIPGRSPTMPDSAYWRGLFPGNIVGNPSGQADTHHYLCYDGKGVRLGVTAARRMA